VELQSELADARVARAGDLAEVAGGVIAYRILELRVIEYVEKLGAKIQSDPFRNPSSLE
jgi:hypothetical protein